MFVPAVHLGRGTRRCRAGNVIRFMKYCNIQSKKERTRKKDDEVHESFAKRFLFLSSRHLFTFRPPLMMLNFIFFPLPLIMS